MKKLILILVIIFSFFNNINTSATTKTLSLEDVASYSNASIIKKEVFGYVNFSSNDSNSDIMNKFVSSTLSSLKFNITSNKNSTVAEYNSSEFSYTVTIANSEYSANDKFISIFYSHKTNNVNIINLRDNIQQILTYFDENPRVSSHIIAKLNKKLSKNEISSTLSYMLKKSQSTYSKDYADSSISFSGYSPLLEEGITVNNKKINIQVSSKYSSIDNSTYIWVGSPIISIEY
ncbi:MAG: YwmB family TATA-box binding protein [Clostridium sp.]